MGQHRRRCEGLSVSAKSVRNYLGAVRDLLAEGLEVRGEWTRRLLATLALAIDFHSWRSLERESGLSREEAVELMLERCDLPSHALEPRNRSTYEHPSTGERRSSHLLLDTRVNRGPRRL